jgi:hypothetical protein
VVSYCPQFGWRSSSTAHPRRRLGRPISAGLAHYWPRQEPWSFLLHVQRSTSTSDAALRRVNVAPFDRPRLDSILNYKPAFYAAATSPPRYLIMPFLLRPCTALRWAYPPPHASNSIHPCCPIRAIVENGWQLNGTNNTDYGTGMVDVTL